MKEKNKKRTLDIILAAAVALMLLILVIMSGNSGNAPESSDTSDDKTEEADVAEEISAKDKESLNYGDKIFDTSYVHTVDILINDWDSFVETAPEEVYSNCSLVIDGERFDNVGIRAKGNSSLKIATRTGNGRYSLKIDFDHYVEDQTYYGLDKLHLNNLSYDGTCIKDYLAYYLMAAMDVPASYCSYVFVTVNGEDHGLYIALEGIDDSYLERNFGKDYGNILKPDDKHNQVVTENTEATTTTQTTTSDSRKSWLAEGQVELATLTYVDDNIDSYEVLFNSAKSDLSDNDKEKLIKSIKKLNEQKDLDEAIDIDEVMSYMTVQNFLVNYDGYTGTRVHNYYLYVDDDGVMSMLPWDYNLSFGTYRKGMTASEVVNCPIDTPYGTEIGSRPMFDWIAYSYSYTEIYHNRLLYLVENYIESNKLEKEIDRVSSMITDYVDRDPTKWVTTEYYEAAVQELKQIVALRGESVKLQVQGEIPSTTAGQEADPSSLLDTGELDTKKTGTSSGN